MRRSQRPGSPGDRLDRQPIGQPGFSSGTTALTFSYTVQPGDNVSDLEATAFNLNGGTIQNGGINADLSGFTTINTGIQLDTTAPTLSSINRAGGTPNNASSEAFTVDF